MRDAVIVEAVRTPVGKRNGGLSGVHPVDLSGHVLKALAERTGIDPALVDDVIWGCVSQVGEQTFDIARNAVLAAGWPESVPGVTVDRQCGSSQQAVHFAAAGVISGQYDVVVAGGVESMSRVPMGFSVSGAWPFGESFRARYDGVAPNQGIGAEMIAERWDLSRTQLDEYSLASHEKAAAAQDEGRFDEQIVPVTTPDGTSGRKDEGIRRGGTLESLAKLKPAFRPDGVITAGNSSQISDGSAALLITTSEKAAELGLTPLARIHTAVLAGADPVIMLTAPIPATTQGAGAQRPVHRPDRRVRGQRGVRAGAAGLAGRDRRRPQGAEPQRRRDRAGPPARRQRRPADDHAGATTCATTASATGCRPCARAAARPTPPSSSCSSPKITCAAPCYDPEHEQFREVVREFLAREVAPHAPGLGDRRDRRPRGVPGCGQARRDRLQRARRVRRRGRRDFRFNAVVAEELAVAGPGTPAFTLHNDIVAPYLVSLATPEQQQRWLPGFASGDLIGAIAMSEPGAGSDLAGVRTHAERDGTTGCCPGPRPSSPPASTPTWSSWSTRTDPTAGHRGFSLLVVERDMPGFTRGRNLEKIGQKSQDTAELFFDQVRVPAANVLGQQGRGFYHLMHNLPAERLSIAVSAVAGARAIFTETVAYAKNRTAFGQPIGAFQHNRFVLAELDTELDIAQVYVDRCLEAVVAGELTAVEAAKAKWWTTELQKRVVDACVQLHGGYGYMLEYPVARAYLDARVQTIYGGTTEIMKEIIGRDLGL